MLSTPAAAADYNITVAPPGSGVAPYTSGPGGLLLQAGDGISSAGNGVYRNILETKDSGNGSGANGGDVRGYNYDGPVASQPFDQDNSNGFPSYVYTGEMPVATIGGTRYVGFALDSQEKGNDSYISIDEFRIYINPNTKVLVEDEFDGEGIDPQGDSVDGGDLGTLVYDLDGFDNGVGDSGADDTAIRLQLYSASSGNADLRLFVPLQNFLDVGVTGGETLYIWTVQGREGKIGGSDYSDNGNTEQWSLLGLHDPNDSEDNPSFTEVLVPEPSTYFGAGLLLLFGIGHWWSRRRGVAGGGSVDSA